MPGEGSGEEGMSACTLPRLFQFPLLEFIYLCSRLTSTLWLTRKILSLAVFIKYFEFEDSVALVHKNI